MSWATLLSETHLIPSFETRLARRDNQPDLLGMVAEANPSLYWYPGGGDDLTPLVFDRPQNPTVERLLRLPPDATSGASVLWINDYLDSLSCFPSHAAFTHGDLWAQLGTTVKVVTPVYRYVIDTKSAETPKIPLSVFRVRIADAAANKPQRAEGEEYVVLFSMAESEQVLRDVFAPHCLKIRVVALLRQGGFSLQRSHFFPNDPYEQYSAIPLLITENEGSVGLPDAYILDRDNLDLPGYEPSELQTSYDGYNTRLWRKTLPESPDVGAPLYGRSSQDGLHVLKDAWQQKSYMQQHCDYLIERLDEAIASTTAPNRGFLGFQLDRAGNENLNDRSRERVWEQAIWQKWSSPDSSAVPGCWHRITSYQTPLFDVAARNNWGHIDLLGVADDGHPVVIELKKEVSSETPLRMALEGSAYAVAIREVWPALRLEFLARLRQLAVDPQIIDQVPLELQRVYVLCLAPDNYWLQWLPLSARGRTVSASTWTAFHQLMTAFEQRGILIGFATVSGGPDGGMAVRRLKGFPLG